MDRIHTEYYGVLIKAEKQSLLDYDRALWGASCTARKYANE
jgi:hypothetical protein